MQATDVHPVTVAPPTKLPNKRWLFLAAKAAASAGLLYWVVRNAELNKVVRALALANVPLILLAFAMCLIGHGLSMTRWRVLLAAQGVHVKRVKVLHSYLVAVFFNNFLPSTMGGDAYRAYESWRWGGTKSGALAVVFVDRFLGLVALMLFALGASIAWRGISGVVPLPIWTIALTAAGMVGVVWVIFFPPQFAMGGPVRGVAFPGSERVGRVIAKVRDAFQAFRGRRDSLGKAALLSLALQTNVVLYYYVMARALGFDLSLPPFFLVIPLSVVLMLIPISINGIGVRESAFAFFFALFGVAEAQSVALALLDYGLLLLVGGAGAIAYALRK